MFFISSRLSLRASCFLLEHVGSLSHCDERQVLLFSSTCIYTYLCHLLLFVPTEQFYLVIIHSAFSAVVASCVILILVTTLDVYLPRFYYTAKLVNREAESTITLFSTFFQKLLPLCLPKLFSGPEDEKISRNTCSCSHF